MKLLVQVEKENPNMYEEHLDQIRNPYRWLYERIANCIPSFFKSADNSHTFINPRVTAESVEEYIKVEFNDTVERGKRQKGSWDEKKNIKITWEEFKSNHLYNEIIMSELLNSFKKLQDNLNELRDRFENHFILKIND